MSEISKIKNPVERLFAFAKERYSISQKKDRGDTPPWTDDPILRDYRFCSIYREDDKVTRWIRNNWREPHADDPDLWFAMCLARLLNLPASLEAVGYPERWNELRFLQKIDRYRQDHGDTKAKIFNGAYIVSAPTSPKHVYLAREILTPLWVQRRTLRPRNGDTLNSYHMQLGQMHGFGSFMTAQVIADLKYHGPLKHAIDWWTFAASGPGSRKGLNAVLERPLGAPWVEDDWRMALSELRKQLLPMFKKAKMPMPHAQDCQNLLCEYSKMHRAMYEGKMPKQKYRWENR